MTRKAFLEILLKRAQLQRQALQMLTPREELNCASEGKELGKGCQGYMYCFLYTEGVWCLRSKECVSSYIKCCCVRVVKEID